MTAKPKSFTDVWSSRVAPALVAPLSILVIVPLLVGGVGIAVTVTGQAAMERMVREMAEERFRGAAMSAARSVGDVLRRADPVLDDLQAHLRRVGASLDLPALAGHMNGVIRLERSVAYLSWSEDDDGDFMGVHQTQEGGYVWEQKLDRQADGTVHRQVFALDTLGGLRPELDEPGHRYDPRTTGWYRQAVDAGGRVWTDPYVWYDLGIPGITCAEPVFDDAGLHGVLTCDFDLNSLSALLAGLSDDAGTRTFLLTRGGVLIGYPGERMVRQVHGAGRGENLLLRDIEEPITRAFAARMPELRAGLSTAFDFSFEVDGDTHQALATIDGLELGHAGRGDGVEWFVVTVGDLEPLLAAAREQERHALTSSAVAVLAAVALSIVFAIHLVRSRRRVVRAERKAAAAEAEARELGSYQLSTLLGEGGMGQVWLAEHRMLARPVAVKLIRPDRLAGGSDTEAAVERFNREARAMARLRSRHTIDIYDFGVAEDGTLFYVMELLHGLDLDELVRRHGPQPVGRTLSILRQAAASLAEAHEAGLVHRDVKPQNIYLCVVPGEHDVVKVLDFGMVRTTRSDDARVTREGTVCGTPAYMAPEQALDPDGIDARADLYALACVGYWLLSGRHVFEREGALAMVHAHLEDPPPRLQEVASVPVPEAVGDLLARCLAKSRDERPAGMAAFVAELDVILRGPGVEPFTEAQAAAWWSEVDLAGEKAPSDHDSAPTIIARTLGATLRRGAV